MSKAEAILKIEPENELRFRGKLKSPCGTNSSCTSPKRSLSFKTPNVSNRRRCFAFRSIHLLFEI